MNVSGPLDRQALARRVDQVSQAMGTHGGGIELVNLSAQGAVRVRFTGLCAGCQLRPLTFAETIEPAIRAVPGVSAVAADGARISEQAAARLRHYHDIQADDLVDFSYPGNPA
jgi:Fe-S cluster biogenesis protein NfuA